MGAILRFLLRVLLAIAIAAIARAVLLAMDEMGFPVAEWLLRQFRLAATGNNVVIAGWAIAGLLGVAGAIAAEWFKLGNRLALLFPQVKDRSKILAGLQDIYVKGSSIRNKRIAAADWDDHYAAANTWLNESAAWIGANARARFLATHGGLAMSYSWAVSPEHSGVICSLDGHLESIDTLIQTPNWDAQS